MVVIKYGWHDRVKAWGQLLYDVGICRMGSRIDVANYRIMGAPKSDRESIESRLLISYLLIEYHQRMELSTKALEKQST